VPPQGTRTDERELGMGDIRYVCLSDLHFGAENSLLTHVPVGGTAVDPFRPSPCLEAFIDCLAELIGHNSTNATKPELILNGDILELALAQDNQAAMTFERFLELAFEKHHLFSRVRFLPGNHDHHLWETARERQYAGYVATVPADAALSPPWHSTRMRQLQPTDRSIESELISALMTRMKLDDVRPEIRYPNFALFNENGRRAVVFHHGHFIESMYLLMTRLQQVAFPGTPEGTEVWDWEANNFAWIDFFWSTLGRSGHWGNDVGLIYDLLQSQKAQDLMAGNLAKTIATRAPALLRPVVRPIVAGVIRRQARRVKTLARADDVHPLLTPDGRRGLQKYVTGPLASQLRKENNDVLPETTTFVFGHTHKPFQERGDYDGFAGGVAVYNTGGWVVDKLTPDPRQGAAAILIDEELNVATLRLYNQQAAGAPPYEVSVDTVDPVGNSLCDRLKTSIDPTVEPWARLSAAVAKELPHRMTVLQQIIDQGIEALRGRA
jgi:hypothetical protein